jgi:hypothetical protein
VACPVRGRLGPTARIDEILDDATLLQLNAELDMRWARLWAWRVLAAWACWDAVAGVDVMELSGAESLRAALLQHDRSSFAPARSTRRLCNVYNGPEFKFPPPPPLPPRSDSAPDSSMTSAPATASQHAHAASTRQAQSPRRAQRISNSASRSAAAGSHHHDLVDSCCRRPRTGQATNTPSLWYRVTWLYLLNK